MVNTTNSLSIQNAPLAVVTHIFVVQWGVFFPIQTAIQHLSCDFKETPIFIVKEMHFQSRHSSNSRPAVGYGC